MDKIEILEDKRINQSNILTPSLKIKIEAVISLTTSKILTKQVTEFKTLNQDLRLMRKAERVNIERKIQRLTLTFLN